MHDMSIWLQAIGSFGFPITITIYLLARFEKRIDALKESIDNLVSVMRKKG